MGRPEANLVRRVLAELNSWPQCQAIKRHGSIYSRAGDPDILGCYRGRMFALEAKAPGKKPSPIQRKRLREWRDAGAVSGRFDSLDHALELVRSIDAP